MRRRLSRLSLKLFKNPFKRLRIRHHLLPLRLVGGPVSLDENVSIPFMPDQNTTPRSIELRVSDTDVFVVVWRVGKETFSMPFKRESDAKGFYHLKMGELREATKQEEAAIKTRLQQQFAESWKGARSVYFYKGFRVRMFFSKSDEHVRINRNFLGLIQGPCPDCGSSETFDAKDPLKSFLNTLDSSLEEGLMRSHSGVFSEGSVCVCSRCPVCRNYPNVSFKAHLNKGLLARLKKVVTPDSEPEG
jgi:hypothetical protein